MYLNLYYEEESLESLASDLKGAYSDFVHWDKQAPATLVLGYCESYPKNSLLFITEGKPEQSTKTTLFISSLGGLLEDAKAILGLNQRLFALEKDWLVDWPNLYRVTDGDNQLLYSNGHPSDPFDFDAEVVADYHLDSLTLERIQMAKDLQLFEAIPLADNNSFWVHRYQGLRDKSGHWTGVVETTEDILPLIHFYLEETYQGLVSLSDTTSSASVQGAGSEDTIKKHD